MMQVNDVRDGAAGLAVAALHSNAIAAVLAVG